MIELPGGEGPVSIEKLVEATKALLEAGETGLTKEQLANRIELSDRRTQDAITILNNQDAVIDSVKTPGARTIRYVMRTPPEWMIHVTSDLQFSAGVAAKLMRKLCGPEMAIPLEYLRDEAYGTMTTQARQEYDRLMARTQIVEGIPFGRTFMAPPGEPSKSILQGVIKLFSKELPAQVHIDYQDPFTGEVRVLLVSPGCLVLDYHAKVLFLLGLDRAREVPMLIALSNIKGLHPAQGLAANFIQHQADMEEIIREAIQGSLSLVDDVPHGWAVVQIRVRDEDARDHLLFGFSNPPGLRVQNDIIEFAVRDLEDVIQWAAREGGLGIKLLGPQELLDRFAGHLRRLRAMLD